MLNRAEMVGAETRDKPGWPCKEKNSSGSPLALRVVCLVLEDRVAKECGELRDVGEVEMRGKEEKNAGKQHKVTH